MGDIDRETGIAELQIAGYDVRYNDNRHTYHIKKGGRAWSPPSVSTVTRAVDLGKSRSLTWWAAKMGADRAVEILERFDRDGTISIPADTLPDLHNAIRTQHSKRLDKAADIGKVVHREIEDWVETGVEGKTHGFATFREWADRWGLMREGALTEGILYNPAEDYAGTFDLIVYLADAPKPGYWLVDIKTANAIRTENALQVAAYAVAAAVRFPELELRGVGILRVPKTEEDGSIEWKPYSDDAVEKAYGAFQAARTVYRWENDR